MYKTLRNSNFLITYCHDKKYMIYYKKLHEKVQKRGTYMLAKKTPMGWNSWNTFGANINESLIRETADAMVATGLKDAGYEYVVIDDCWSEMQRDSNGKLVASKEKFPSGMRDLADYIHSKGLKFGMYSCAGTKTCAGYPSSFDYEFIDAQTFAEFGIDFLKYDFCYKPAYANGPLLYHRMGMALKASGREILFSACNWGSDNVGQWIRSTGAHMYRSTGDIIDNPQSFKDIARSQIPLLSMSGPGCYNDIDMLIVGMHNKGNVACGGCTDDEYEMHFALWCMMASPLMIGCDIRNMDERTFSTLTNKKYIARDQDEEARPPFPVGGNLGDSFALFRHLSDNKYALGFFNFTDATSQSIELFDIGLPNHCGFGLKLSNMLTGECLGIFTGNVALPIKPHAATMFDAEIVKL